MHLNTNSEVCPSYGIEAYVRVKQSDCFPRVLTRQQQNVYIFICAFEYKLPISGNLKLTLNLTTTRHNKCTHPLISYELRVSVDSNSDLPTNCFTIHFCNINLINCVAICSSFVLINKTHKPLNDPSALNVNSTR